MRTFKVTLTLLVSFGLLAPSAFGALPRDYQVWPSREDEFAKLPPYCKIRLKGQADPKFKSEFDALYSSMTSDFIHIHHYCAGLNVMNYYYRTSGRADKQKVLREAVNQFSYMVDKAKPDWYMMPEIYANRGEAYLLAGNFSAAISDLNKALSLNPKILKPYTLLADHYQRFKQTGNALDITVQGLKHNPESKGLRKRYLSLGGKEPFPEPYKQVTVTETPVPENPSNPATASESGTAVTAPSAPMPESTTASDATQSAPKTIGAPGNPYCRFCPDPTPTAAPSTPAKP